MSLSASDLSIIATPPAKRLSIKTFVQEREPNVREAGNAAMRGAAFFLTHEVRGIEQAAKTLQEQARRVSVLVTAK